MTNSDDDKEGGILPLSDPQHSMYDPTTATTTPSEGTGDETMVQAVDDIDPVLILPEDIFEDSDTRGGIIVRYVVTATDNSGSVSEIMCEPKSGSVFENGVTIVKCTALDAAGNAAIGQFTVTVTGNGEERVGIIPEIPINTP